MARIHRRVGAIIEHEETGEIGIIASIGDEGIEVRWNFGGVSFESPTDLIFLR